MRTRSQGRVTLAGAAEANEYQNKEAKQLFPTKGNESKHSCY